MRKILALALALSLAVSIAVPAGAAGAEEGLYASYDAEAGSLGGRIEARDMGSVTGESGVSGYVVPESSGAAAYLLTPISRGEPRGYGIDIEELEYGAEGFRLLRLTPGGEYRDSGSIAFYIDGKDNSGFPVVFENYKQPEPDVISPAHTAAAEEIVEGHDKSYYGPAAFTYDGGTYYLGITDAVQVTQPYSAGGIEADSDTVVHCRNCAAFWTHDENGYELVGAGTRDELLEAFNDTLTLSIYAIGNEDAVIPAQIKFVSQNGWEPAACWRFNKDNGGDWEIRVTGTINGREVVSHTLFSWTVNKVESETFTAEEGVEGINSWLGGFTPDSLTRYKIYLEPGEFKGVITVPDGMSVEIYGSRDDKNMSVTNLRGGICFGADSHSYFERINFIGEGKDKPARSDGSPNYAVYGGNGGTAACANYTFCTFSDYYTAILCEGRFCAIGDGLGSEFRNNHIAFYFDVSEGDGGGNPHMTGNVFIENDVAIDLAGFAPDFPPRRYVFRQLSFIDNGVDVRNNSGRYFFLPNNYFSHDGTEEIRTATSGDPMLNLVSAFPTADEAFTRYNYGDDRPVVANSMAEDYPIPASELDGKLISVIDDAGGDALLATLSFPESAASGNGGAARLRPASGDEAAFDPTLEVERGEASVKISINALPAGKTPTVTVPCEGWYGAAVSFGGEELEASFADGSVSFIASEGGEYTIERLYEPEEPEGPGWPDFPSPPVNVNPGGGVKPEEPDEPDEPETPGLPFTDVDEADWFAGAVEYVCEKGLMEGTGETSFEPDAGLTRAMFWAVLARAEGEIITGPGWTEAAREWAETAGASDGTNAEGEITREQLVTMLWRCLGKPSAAGALEGWSDAGKVSAWAREAMAWAVEAGIITGDGEALSPRAHATRAQCAAILMRSGL